MFAATLSTHEIDQQRLQRLTLAAAIAVSTTALSVASVWTLERLGVDRVSGPNEQLEIAQFSLMPPPRIDPPPPPPKVTGSAIADNPDASVEPAIKPDLLDVEEPGLDRTISPTIPIGKGGDPFGDIGCPPHLCGTGTNKLVGPPCVGPLCVGTSKPPIVAIPDPAPAEVEFSALRCLACADPDEASLRKSVGNAHAHRGNVVARFCVDVRGRVESSSLDVTDSYGVKAVDQIVTRTIAGWRFSPLKIDGKPRRACSEARFAIRFD